MIRHPILHSAYTNPFCFIPLVKTYVELDTHYYIEESLVCKQIRLTNMETGEYVLFKQQPSHYTDEKLWISLNTWDVRVKISDNDFVVVNIEDYIQHNWNGLIFLLPMGEANDFTVDIMHVVIDREEIELARVKQYRTIERYIDSTGIKAR